MPRTCVQLVAVIGSLAASMALLGCDDNGMRTVEAKTPMAEARVSTRLPPSEVSDDFLLATATIAAEAASVPHPVAAAVVAEPPVPAPPPANAMPTAPDDTATNQMPSETNTQPDAPTNAQ